MKKEKKLKQQISSVEDNTLSEDTLATVTGGMVVSQQQAAALAQRRGPVVQQTHLQNGLPVTRFADGEKIIGMEL